MNEPVQHCARCGCPQFEDDEYIAVDEEDGYDGSLCAECYAIETV